MKTLIVMMLLTASLLMTTPTASACSVFEDPTGLTPTCVDRYENGFGDETCQDAGAHSEGTTVTTGVPDVASVYVDDSSYCFNFGFGGPSEGGSTYGSVRLNGVGFVSVGQYESQSDFGDSSGTDVAVGGAEGGAVGVGNSRSTSEFGSECALYAYVGESLYESVPC